MAVRDKSQFIPNETYFITFTILDWQKVFISDVYYNLVYKWFDYMKMHYNNKIWAYVIMPNHLHCLVKISDQAPVISKLIQNAKRFLSYGIVELLEKGNDHKLLDLFASQADKNKGAKHKVFEQRYDSLLIQTKSIFLEKINYIHRNPCQEKWQLASAPEEYRHSSASNYILNIGIYDVNIIDL